MERFKINRSALKIAGSYAALAAVYILVSDRVLTILVSDLSTYEALQTYKGWIFVGTTSLALLQILNSGFKRLQGQTVAAVAARGQLEMALEAAGGAVWSAADLGDGTIDLTAVGAFAEALGLDLNRPVRVLDLQDRVHPQDRDKLTAAVRAYSPNTGAGDIPIFRIRLKDGRDRWVKVHVAPTAGRGQPATPMSGTVFDVSDLQDVSTKLSEVVASSEMGTWRLDFRTGINDINDQWAAIIGYTREELGTVTLDVWKKLVHPDDLAGIERTSSRYTAGDHFFGDEFRMLHKNGAWVWILSRGRTVEIDASGAPLVLVGVHIDITRRKLLEAELQSERDFLVRLMETSTSGVLALNSAGTIVFVNKAAEDILGGTSAQIVGLQHDDPAWNARSLDGLPLAPEEFPYTRVVRDNATVSDVRLAFRHPNGQDRVLSVNAARTAEGEGPSSVVCTINDITDQLAKDQVLESAAAYATFAALHDPMTGLPNRVLFEDHLEQAIQRARRDGTLLAQVFVDVDNFKQINDRFGHRLGDELILCVAHRLNAKRGNALVISRVAGDEFTLLYEISSQSRVSAIVSELLLAFETPFELADTAVYLSASVGVSVYPIDATSADEVWLNSDMAMYEAKATGRNHYVKYSSELRDRMARETQIAQSVRRALHEDRFSLVLQPKVYLSDLEHPAGAEVLTRCKDLEVQGIGPAEYIPIAEKAGLSRQIDLMVVDKLGAMMANLRSLMHEMRVSINISPDSLRGSGFGSTFLGALARAGLTNKDILVELTEGVIMDNTSNVREAVNLLLENGFELSADDFGTGYSSLAYLQRLQLNEIKIDRSFIMRLGMPEKASDPVVRAILAMADTLGIRTVAEGIETQAQLDWLREHGCSMGQGFLFGPGLPPEMFIDKFLTKGNTRNELPGGEIVAR